MRAREKLKSAGPESDEMRATREEEWSSINQEGKRALGARVRKDTASSAWDSAVCRGGCNKMPQTRGLKRQKAVFSQFWKLEARGAGQAWFLLSLSPWFADGCFLAVSSCGVSFVSTSQYLSVCPNFLTLAGHQACWIRAHPVDFVLI